MLSQIPKAHYFLYLHNILLYTDTTFSSSMHIFFRFVSTLICTVSPWGCLIYNFPKWMGRILKLCLEREVFFSITTLDLKKKKKKFFTVKLTVLVSRIQCSDWTSLSTTQCSSSAFNPLQLFHPTPYPLPFWLTSVL